MSRKDDPEYCWCQSAFVDAMKPETLTPQEKFNIRASQHAARIRDIALELDIVGHPKLPLLYELAYDYGHSAGFEEVEIYYRSMGLLLQK